MASCGCGGLWAWATEHTERWGSTLAAGGGTGVAGAGAPHGCFHPCRGPRASRHIVTFCTGRGPHKSRARPERNKTHTREETGLPTNAAPPRFDIHKPTWARGRHTARVQIDDRLVLAIRRPSLYSGARCLITVIMADQQGDAALDAALELNAALDSNSGKGKGRKGAKGRKDDTFSGLTLEDFQAVATSKEEIQKLAAETTRCPSCRVAVATMLRGRVDEFHLRSFVVDDATDFRVAPGYTSGDKAGSLFQAFPLAGCLDNVRPATKNSSRCRLHGNTNRLTPQGEVAVKEAWSTLRDRSSVCNVPVDSLITSFEQHLSKMGYCVDCQGNVEDAFDILIGQQDEPEAADDSSDEEGYSEVRSRVAPHTDESPAAARTAHCAHLTAQYAT